MLEFDDASKRFGSLAALDGCTLTAKPGRLTGLLAAQWGRQDHGHARCASDSSIDRLTLSVLILAVAIGGVVTFAVSDVIIGVAVGAAFLAGTTRVAKTWDGRRERGTCQP